MSRTHWLNSPDKSFIMIYLDNAATTLVPEEVIRVISESLSRVYGNPSSIHGEGRKARIVIEKARRAIASLLNVQPGEIVFTSGGTEGNNAILWSCFHDLGIKCFITSPLEHPSVINTLAAIKQHGGARVLFVNRLPDGHIDPYHLEQLIVENPESLVCLMHANNEIGNLLPVKTVAALCRKHGALFHSDMVQTIGKFHTDIRALGPDFAVASAHKFHGPKGVGFMFVKSRAGMRPFIAGGAQERSLRAGTENVSGIAGMAAALEWISQDLDESRALITSLKDSLISGIRSGLPEIGFNGDPDRSSLHTIVNLRLPDYLDPDLVLPRLEQYGICASSGSACSSGSHKGSHVLRALDPEEKHPSLRISFSKFNTHQDVDHLLGALKKLIEYR